jgi:bifunctional UDP-N-acetylglucosamine pyrophosphorylase/glucosamine-1-phosphate N-acetyltransferase
VELSVLNRIMRKRINEGHMLNGVTMIDPDAVYIEKGVSIGKDTILYPGTFLEGDTVIGAGCEIGPNVKIKDSTLGEGIKIENAGVDSVVIKDHVTIGPYVYLRPGTVLEEKVKVGRFVELKNTKVASGSKVPHLSYVGDAEIGKGVNIGAGVITVNYDGKNKHKTIIGDDAFIGCNANLIAPIKIGDGAYVAAGSTITDDVEEKSLAIARERQTNKKDWINKYK